MEGVTDSDGDRYRLLDDTVLAVEECVSRGRLYDLVLDSVETLVSADGRLSVERPDGEVAVVGTTLADGEGDGDPSDSTVDEQNLGQLLADGAEITVDPAYAGSDPSLTEYEQVLVVPLAGAGVLEVAGGPFDDTDRDLLVRFARHVGRKLRRLDVGEELEASKRRLLSLMSNAPGMVYRCENDENRRMTFVSQGCLDLTGYDRATLMDGDVEWGPDVVHPADRETANEEIQTAVENVKLYQSVYRIVTKDGQERWVWDNGGGVFEDGRATRLEGFIFDITQRKQREQRLQVLNRVLRHNLRNNMNIIMGYAETLQGELSGPPPETHAGYIKEQAEELTSLGEKARRIERAMRLDDDTEQPVDLVELVADVVETFAESFPDADITVDLPPFAVVKTAAPLDFALENLVENAVVHNDTESPTVDVTVETVSGERNQWVELKVSDDGPGIPEHEVETLVKGEETPLTHGSGLGLWLVNWIATRAGGELRFDENEPRGSVVTLKLPQSGDHEP